MSFPRLAPVFTKEQLAYILISATEELDLNDEHSPIAHEIVEIIEEYFELLEREED